MPAKNTVKIYIEGGYYHLYNRGVEKRSIFQDDDDYKKFQNLLKVYLSTPKRSDLITAHYNRKNLNGQVILLAYCLMPNHFHLLVRQNSKNGIADLVHCLNTSYVAYFNKKYDRVGALFQSRYKAALVENDSYLLHLSRYIHLNPAGFNKKIEKYPYSSYLSYIENTKTEWLKPQMILGYFKRSKRKDVSDYFSYQDFVEDYQADSEKYIKGLELESP